MIAPTPMCASGLTTAAAMTTTPGDRCAEGATTAEEWTAVNNSTPDPMHLSAILRRAALSPIPRATKTFLLFASWIIQFPSPKTVSPRISAEYVGAASSMNPATETRRLSRISATTFPCPLAPYTNIELDADVSVIVLAPQTSLRSHVLADLFLRALAPSKKSEPKCEHQARNSSGPRTTHPGRTSVPSSPHCGRLPGPSR